MTPIIQLVSLLILALFFPKQASAFYLPNTEEWWTNNYTYYDVKNYKGSVDIIKSPHARTLAEAYRLMNGLDVPHKYEDYDSDYFSDRAANENWIEEAGKILKKNINFKSAFKFAYYCNAKSALKFLEERNKRFGKSNSYVKEWIEAQNTVFRNCDSYYDRSGGNIFLPKEFTKNEADSAELKQFKKDDREYQIASAYFYAKKFEEALEGYTKIANNPSSIHYATANYMIARTLLHKNNVDKSYQKIQSIIRDPKLKAVAQDSAELLGALAESSYKSDYRKELLDEITKKLVKKHDTSNEKKIFSKEFAKLNYDFWYILSYLSDESEIIQMASKSDILDWLLSFTGNNFYNDGDCKKQNEETDITSDKPKKIEKCVEKNPILDHAIEKWKSTKRIHWLVAAALNSPADHKFSDEVIAVYKKLHAKINAATASDEELYAYPTIIFYAVDFLLRKKRYNEVETIVYAALENKKEFAPRIAAEAISFWLAMEENTKARKMIDRVIAQKDLMDISQFYSFKMVSAQSLDELMQTGSDLYFYKTKDHITSPMGETYSHVTYYGTTHQLRNSEEFVETKNFPAPIPEILNLMPMAKLAELSENKKLSSHAQTELKLVTWTRAILLEKYDIADSMATSLKDLIPELSSQFQSYLNEKDQKRKHRFAIYLLLKNPRVKPYIKESYGDYYSEDLVEKSKFEAIDIQDHDGNNWWCSSNKNKLMEIANDSLKREVYYQWPFEDHDQMAAKYKPLELINDEELKKLEQIGGAVSYLPTEVVKWYNDTSLLSRYWDHQNKLLPEALHLAVRVTRYGCYADGNRGTYSKKAFMTLHKDIFFDKKWKEKTPYWFNSVTR